MKKKEETKLPFDITTSEAQKKKLSHFIKILNLGEPELIESVLLPLERFVLYEFLRTNSPLTRKIIQDSIIINIWNCYLEEDVYRNVPGGAHKKHKTSDVWEHKERPLTSEELERIKAVMMKNGVKYPTYEKIEATINILEDWGLLVRRSEGTGKRARFFLMLNPFFPVNDRKALREYFGKRKEDYLTW